MQNLNKNLILMGLVFAVALVASPAKTEAYKQSGFYELSYNGPTLDEQILTPVIYYLDPSETVVGEAGRQVNVIGTNFIHGATVMWNGNPRPTIFANSNRLLVELDKYDFLTPGQFEVVVVNPTPANNVSNTKLFTVKSNSGVDAAGTVAGASTGGSNVSKTTAVTKKANLAKSSTNAGTVAGASTSNGTNNGNGLTAGAGNANASFVPDTLVGWMTLCVLVMLGVILFRKLWVTEQEKNAPLKHA